MAAWTPTAAQPWRRPPMQLHLPQDPPARPPTAACEDQALQSAHWIPKDHRQDMACLIITQAQTPPQQPAGQRMHTRGGSVLGTQRHGRGGEQTFVSASSTRVGLRLAAGVWMMWMEPSSSTTPCTPRQQVKGCVLCRSEAGLSSHAVAAGAALLLFHPLSHNSEQGTRAGGSHLKFVQLMTSTSLKILIPQPYCCEAAAGV